jgi:hypothetical protein
VGEIAEDEIDAAGDQLAERVHVPGEPVELGKRV